MHEQNGYTHISHSYVSRCRQGDKKAYRALYDLYARAMFNTAARILSNKAEAEEAVQDSFVKAFASLERFDQKYSFGAWLKRIVINRSLDLLRKKKVILVPLRDEHAEEQDSAGEEEPPYRIESVLAQMQQLPPGYRTILSLIVFENCTHREVAELLGISEGTSKSQYNRAKKKLLELLKQNTPCHD
jgi:RNA polymerase sigma factor (sigma-70 family)